MGTIVRPQPSMRWITIPVVADYLFSHLGFFAVLPVLPLLLDRMQPGTGAWFIGLALFIFNFAVRGASLFFAGLLHRAPVRLAMSAGLLMAAAGFTLLPVVPGAAGILALLLLAGTGISTNGLIARVFVAMSLNRPADRNTVFATIQVAVNVSAAIGPLAANLLIGRYGDTVLLLAVAAMYVVAAGVVVTTIPGTLLPQDGDMRPPLRLGLLRDVVIDLEIRRVSVVTALGSFLYGQFFSAFALHVIALTAAPALRASFFTANAVLVVVAQIPVALYTKRRLEAGSAPLTFLVVGIVVFASSFAVLGVAGATVVGTFAAVTVFSLAETFFTPMVNTAFTAIPGDRPLVELFNMRQVAATVGESLGAFTGGALFLTAGQHGCAWLYWSLLAVIGITASVPYLWRCGGASVVV